MTPTPAESVETTTTMLQVLNLACMVKSADEMCVFLDAYARSAGISRHVAAKNVRTGASWLGMGEEIDRRLNQLVIDSGYDQERK